MNKEKLLKLDYSGNLVHEDVELFLKDKYNFNIRNIDCFTNIGSSYSIGMFGCGKNQPALRYIPEGSFFKDYIPNETENEWFTRMINLAIDLIIKFNK